MTGSGSSFEKVLVDMRCLSVLRSLWLRSSSCSVLAGWQKQWPTRRLLCSHPRLHELFAMPALQRFLDQQQEPLLQPQEHRGTSRPELAAQIRLLRSKEQELCETERLAREVTAEKSLSRQLKGNQNKNRCSKATAPVQSHGKEEGVLVTLTVTSDTQTYEALNCSLVE